MVPYFEDIRKNIGPMLRERVSGFSRFRIGVVLYKDYWPDEYITRNYPYTSDIAVIERIVKSAVVYGGGDIPEAEVEALNAAETEFDWSADGRQVIVLTDAPPHPDPRGKILFDDVASMAAAKGARVARPQPIIGRDMKDIADPLHGLSQPRRRRADPRSRTRDQAPQDESGGCPAAPVPAPKIPPRTSFRATADPTKPVAPVTSVGDMAPMMHPIWRGITTQFRGTEAFLSRKDHCRHPLHPKKAA